MPRIRLTAALVAVLSFSACDNPMPTPPDRHAVSPTSPRLALDGAANPLAPLNAALAAGGEAVRVAVAEYYTDGSSGRLGQTIFANDRGNKQLPHHFVSGDPRRGGASGISYVVDAFDGGTAGGLTAAETTGAITAAMSTWDEQGCSEPALTSLGAAPIDLGFVQALLGFGGVFGWVADLTHAGWLPGAFFDVLAPNGSTFILGVTFTLVWVDGAGNPTDIDRDGRADVAFREIYYNDAFPWAVQGGHIDVETVALHEAGHGLSQGHFGRIFRTDANGAIHFAPRAVMNAAYSGVQHAPTGTDSGGHCSIWSSWPS
ncbi:MAG: hypothetical protein ACRELD_14625 [Longimicrobiales bacterium]